MMPSKTADESAANSPDDIYFNLIVQEKALALLSKKIAEGLKRKVGVGKILEFRSEAGLACMNAHVSVCIKLLEEGPLSKTDKFLLKCQQERIQRLNDELKGVLDSEYNRLQMEKGIMQTPLFFSQLSAIVFGGLLVAIGVKEKSPIIIGGGALVILFSLAVMKVMNDQAKLNVILAKFSEHERLFDRQFNRMKAENKSPCFQGALAHMRDPQ
jgi:hypothetical protein